MTIAIKTKGTESFYRERIVIAVPAEHEQEIYDYMDDNSIDVPRF